MSQYYHHQFLGTRFHHSPEGTKVGGTQNEYDELLKRIDRGEQPQATMKEASKALPKAATETMPPLGPVDRVRRWLLGTGQQRNLQ